jgi:hypothetical protein
LAFGLRPWYANPKTFAADADAAQMQAKRLRDVEQSAAFAAAEKRMQDYLDKKQSGPPAYVSNVQDIGEWLCWVFGCLCVCICKARIVD